MYFGAYAAAQLDRYQMSVVQGAAIYACLLALLAFYLAPGFSISRAWLAERFHGLGGAACCVVLFLLPYLVYCAGTADFHWQAFAKLAALCVVPFGVFAAVPVDSSRVMRLQDVVVLAWLTLPVLFGQIGGIWSVPLNLDFMVRVFLVGVGAWAFLVLRGVPDAGYEFRLSRSTFREVVTNFAGFTAVAIPLGFALRFIAWNPNWRGLPAFLFDYITLFLFVAVAEELVFRGLLQNLLEGSLGSRYAAQACASVLFGLSHIRHAPAPNWRYVILATVAGWFYGAAYRRNHSLMSSAATHALVDALWRTWFTLPRP